MPRNGVENNKLRLEDRAAHDWYRFVLSFPAHLVRDYLERFELQRHHRVLDPFCGTGTTLVECKKRGIPSIGVEAHPMSAFASRTKVDWKPPAHELIAHSCSVAETATRRLRKEGVEDTPLFVDKREIKFVEALRTLPPETYKLLLTNSISPLPLHKTLVLLDCLKQRQDKRFYHHQLLALAKALVSSISNLRFGPEVGVGPAKADAAVISSWLAQVRAMADDLEELQLLDSAPAKVHQGDARVLTDDILPNSIDAVITSPPYPNEKDYTRTTRLETVLLGFATDQQEMRTLKKTLLRSNTRGVYKEDDDEKWVEQHPEIGRIADAIEARRIELGKTSGFERLYARVTKLYFGGMARHLFHLQRVLRPNAHLAYVVGDQASYLRVPIRTGQLLAGIAQSQGYELVRIDLFRTRLSTVTKQQLREEVVVLRWPGEERQ